MAIGFGSYFGGVAEGQQFREQQDLRKRDQALREQESERRALEADQMRQMREFQIKEAADKQKMSEDLAAIPTTYDEAPTALMASHLQALGRNSDGSYFTPEQAEGIRRALVNDPKSASQFVTALSGAQTGGAKRNYAVTVDEGGNLSYGATGIQRSQADIAREQARIMMRRGDPMSALTAQQLVVNAHKADRDLVEKRMNEIMSTPLPDQEKANMMASFLTETSGIPGNFRMLPAEGGKKFALQYVDPRTGEVRTDQKPRSLEEIWRDTIKYNTLDNYKSMFDLNVKEAKLPAELSKGEADASGAQADARVKQGTIGSRIAAGPLENKKTEAQIRLLGSQAGYYDNVLDFRKAIAENKGNMTARKMSVKVLRENGKYEPVDVLVSSKDGALSFTRADGTALSAAETNAVNSAWGQQSKIAAIDERYTLDRAALRKRLEDPNANFDDIRKVEGQLEQRRDDQIARVQFDGLPKTERVDALVEIMQSPNRNPLELASVVGATTQEVEAAKKRIAELAQGTKAPASAIPTSTTPATPPAKPQATPPSSAPPVKPPGGGKNSDRRTEAALDAEQRGREARTQDAITRTGFDTGIYIYNNMPTATAADRQAKGEAARRLLDRYGKNTGPLTVEQARIVNSTLPDDVNRYIK